MSQIIGKLYENITNNDIVQLGIENIKNNKFLQSSVQVCNIAREVYTQVQNEGDEHKKLEEHYLDATSKVASIPKEDIPSRVDYKVVSTTASQGRKIKRLTKKVT